MIEPLLYSFGKIDSRCRGYAFLVTDPTKLPLARHGQYYSNLENLEGLKKTSSVLLIEPNQAGIKMEENHHLKQRGWSCIAVFNQDGIWYTHRFCGQTKAELAAVGLSKTERQGTGPLAGGVRLLRAIYIHQLKLTPEFLQEYCTVLEDCV